jgi:hypothetical protein
VPVAGGRLSVSANLEGLIAVDGHPGCTERTLPLVGCALSDGIHRVHVYGDDPRVDHSFTVDIQGAEVKRDLRFGLVEALPGYRLVRGDDPSAAQRLAVLPGTYDLTLIDQASGARRAIAVTVEHDQVSFVP